MYNNLRIEDKRIFLDNFELRGVKEYTISDDEKGDTKLSLTMYIGDNPKLEVNSTRDYINSNFAKNVECE